jgi:muramidase (phage lysozyme)
MRKILAALVGLIAIAAPLCAENTAFQQLLDNSRGGAAAVPLPEIVPAHADGTVDMVQYLPPDNDEPGFAWPGRNKGLEDNFVYIGGEATFLKISDAQSEALAEGSGKCALSPKTLYKISARPGFKGEHMTVTLAEPLPGCQLASGYIYISHVSSSSAGGAWELPRNIRAFLDTLAYAEGTDDRYNYIFTHATFESYADHPRKRKCAGKLCSNASGRYQFLSDTWDGLAPGLGLTDFTPPSQDKAVVETIRRSGAFRNVSKASKYEEFTEALRKLNGVWASLPGSPYGQPTHTKAQLWKVYKAALAKY